MKNDLVLVNTQADALGITLRVSTPTAIVERSFSIPGNGVLALPLHDASLFGTQANTYGPFTIEASRSNSFVAETLRKRQIGSELDFIIPTQVE